MWSKESTQKTLSTISELKRAQRLQLKTGRLLCTVSKG